MLLSKIEFNYVKKQDKTDNLIIRRTITERVNYTTMIYNCVTFPVAITTTFTAICK